MSNDSVPPRRWKLVGWVLLPLVLLIAGGTWFASERDALQLRGGLNDRIGIPQHEFEQRVRSYILEHPEIIAEAINRLEARRGEQAANEAQAALKAHADEVFHDPSSPVGGNPDGNATVAEFFDYNCPYCRMMAPLMEQAESADPQLRIVYKEFPVLGPNSVFAAKAALAANKQGKYVAFHRALYRVRGQVDESKVIETGE
ncbi:Thioredoxin [Bradyrhizobium sp. Rc2d]|nr:thioredoxin domain-containing protein [Bradyrhizobium sp. Rc2d]SDI18330.1 Thioredoxin [Bradyrhizobium sp. Rc2d]